MSVMPCNHPGGHECWCPPGALRDVEDNVNSFRDKFYWQQMPSHTHQSQSSCCQIAATQEVLHSKLYVHFLSFLSEVLVGSIISFWMAPL